MLTQVNKAVVVEPTNVFSAGAPRTRTPSSPCWPTAARTRACAPTAARSWSAGSTRSRRATTAAATSTRSGSSSTTRWRATTASRALPEAQVGDRFDKPLTAVVDYSFGNYKFLVREVPPIVRGRLTPERAKPAGKDELSIASYNVENLDPVNDAEPHAGDRAPDHRQPALAGHPRAERDAGPRRRGPAGPGRRPDVAGARRGDRRGGRTRATSTARSTRSTTRTAARRTRTSASASCSTRRACSSSTAPGGTATDRDRGRPGAARRAADVQPRPRRPDERGVEEQPQAAGRRVPLPRQDAVPGREPLRLQGRRRARCSGASRSRTGRARSSAASRRRSSTAGSSACRTPIRSRASWCSGTSTTSSSRSRSGSCRWAAGGLIPELVDLWHLVPQDERYSYIFQGNGQVLDHILISPMPAARDAGASRRCTSTRSSTTSSCPTTTRRCCG